MCQTPLNTAHAQVHPEMLGLCRLPAALAVSCFSTCFSELEPEALLQSALRAGAGGLGAVRAAIPLAAAVPHHHDDDDDDDDDDDGIKQRQPRNLEA